jgi:hypothetical protein
MIRAVVNNGVIQPLEPLPASWENGRELDVDARQEPLGNGPDDLDEWSLEMNALTATLDDPTEWQEIDALLAEADRQAKAQSIHHRGAESAEKSN